MFWPEARRKPGVSRVHRNLEAARGQAACSPAGGGSTDPPAHLDAADLHPISSTPRTARWPTSAFSSGRRLHADYTKWRKQPCPPTSRPSSLRSSSRMGFGRTPRSRASAATFSQYVSRAHQRRDAESRRGSSYFTGLVEGFRARSKQSCRRSRSWPRPMSGQVELSAGHPSPGVSRASPITRPRRRSSPTSRRTQFNVDGTGVTVDAISDSVSQWGNGARKKGDGLADSYQDGRPQCQPAGRRAGRRCGRQHRRRPGDARERPRHRPGGQPRVRRRRRFRRPGR